MLQRMKTENLNLMCGVCGVVLFLLVVNSVLVAVVVSYSQIFPIPLLIETFSVVTQAWRVSVVVSI